MRSPSLPTNPAALRAGALALGSLLPRLARLGFAGPPSRNDRGDVIDAELHVLLELMERSGQPPLERQSPNHARASYRFGVALLGPRRRHPVELVNAEGLELRVHRPGPHKGGPTVVFFHGGGFVIGDAAMYDGVVGELARRSGCTFICVPYRQAPEHPFPAGLEDAVRGYRWITDHAASLDLDPRRIGVMGDSAGATLAIAVAQTQITSGGVVPSLQCLVYPAVDHTGNTASRRRLSQGYILTEEVLDYFTGHYLGGPVDPDDPRLAPMAFPNPSAMPPTLLVTAGFDPLRDEGENYGAHLSDAGVCVDHVYWPDLVHGAFTMGGALATPRRRVNALARQLGQAMRQQPVRLRRVA